MLAQTCDVTVPRLHHGVVEHLGDQRAAVAWTLRVGPATYRHIDVANCSITTIHASSTGPRLVALNDTSHLPGSER